MAQITKETIRYLAKLCRIACTPEQEKALADDIEEILGYIELLNTLDTDGIIPCNFVTETLTQTPVRADEIGKPLSREEFLKNAPQHISGMIRVPQVLKE